MLMTTKKHKKIVAELEALIKYKDEQIEEIVEYNDELAEALEEMQSMYPFNLGDVVFDVQLRSSTGRFTKTKPSREHCIINEVVVDKKNYFNLVNRLASKDVFFTLDAATKHLDNVCVE